MQRRQFLTGAVAAGAAAALAQASPARIAGFLGAEKAGGGAGPLTPAAIGKIPVAVALTEGATVIDFAGPWEVFQDVHVPERGATMDEMMPFRLFTVGESTKPIIGSGGLQLVPDYTFENAPQPKVIVVGAQRGGDALHAWLRKASEKADITMSVCTGAFQLAEAGMLSGKSATTHHAFIDRFAKQFPDIQVKRGLRFVETSPKIATAGGLSSGIDLALRVVDRYFGRKTAESTAGYMEYQSRGWVV
jgi:transcriptional regulator GlxA family with amidase domain